MLLTKDEMERAFQNVSSFLTPTPVIRSQHLSAAHGLEVFLKLENLQPTHSFKIRGAFNAITLLPEQQRKRGIICASVGNHGLAVSLVCASLGIPCRVFLPSKTSPAKLDAITRLGAAVVLHGDFWDDANSLALLTAETEGCAYIPTFDHPHVMAGQGTVGMELLQQIKGLDSVIVSVGGGGLICGIVSALKHFSPQTKVIGVETNGAHCVWLSVQAGHIVELPAITSVADGLGARKTGPRQFDIISKYVDELIVVEDSEAIAALLESLNQDKILIEPAASCTLAALKSGRIRTHLGKRVAAIMCGGNVRLEQVCQWQSQSSGLSL